nr:hypothetical protein [Actinomycetota bacterium]
GKGWVRNGLVAVAAAGMMLAPAAPARASTSTYDCKIMGPYYVEEAVDCAYYLVTILINR